MKPNLLQDYDVIGFDVDQCLAKYNVKQYSEDMTKQYLSDLVAKGYPDTLNAYDAALLAQT